MSIEDIINANKNFSMQSGKTEKPVIKPIPGGICASKGFLAAGVHCGIKKTAEKTDLALVFCRVPCNAAAVYTKNKVKAAPIYVDMEHLKDGKAQAILANSGNANACAPNGEENAEKMAAAAAAALGISSQDVIVASTGVIGVELEVEKIEKAVPGLASSLSPEGSNSAAKAIMTSDTYEKEYAVSVEIGTKTVNIGGISKGSGMIHPNMGTTLNFLSTDAAITGELLQKALNDCVKKSFNQISVDGDTSTNDMACILADGLAGNPVIDSEKSPAYEVFKEALQTLCIYLARELARDGEGASRLITCIVSGAATEEKAEVMSKAVISSNLTKAAMFGCDANWGRILCALGYSGADFDYEKTEVFFRSKGGEIKVCENGRGLAFDEDLAKKVLSEEEVDILVDIHEGTQSATAWGCDLTYDYVKINGDYRS